MSDIPSDLFQQKSLITKLELLQKIITAPKSRNVTAHQSPSSYSSTAGTNAKPFSEIIREASVKYGIDEDVISAVIQQESSYNPNAVSSCGAIGLMQLMPATAKSLGVTDPYNAEQNIMAGTKYLKQQIDAFGGNLALGLAAYNAGSGAVRKYGGIPPYKETQEYVKKIIHTVDSLA
jgi:Soluble lytic murein transglycosylase and related regulatory proteins (some contain LysM/invasin domains)